MDNIEEQQRFISEGEIIYLPSGKEDLSEPNLMKQVSLDSIDGEWSQNLAKVKNSKYLNHALMADHAQEVARYQNTDRSPSESRATNSNRFPIQQPDRNVKSRG